jgi:hypothetical protein
VTSQTQGPPFSTARIPNRTLQTRNGLKKKKKTRRTVAQLTWNCAKAGILLH